MGGLVAWLAFDDRRARATPVGYADCPGAASAGDWGLSRPGRETSDAPNRHSAARGNGAGCPLCVIKHLHLPAARGSRRLPTLYVLLVLSEGVAYQRDAVSGYVWAERCGAGRIDADRNLRQEGGG